MAGSYPVLSPLGGTPREVARAVNMLLTNTDGIVGPKQAAIADDASGAANEATVNAILAALRARGIIET